MRLVVGSAAEMEALQQPAAMAAVGQGLSIAFSAAVEVEVVVPPAAARVESHTTSSVPQQA